MLSRRTQLFGTSGTANARAAAAAASASGRQIIDLTSGEIWSDLAPTIRDGALEAIKRNANRYTDTIGLLELRRAIAKMLTTQLGSEWAAEEVAITAGAKQGLFNAAMVLIDPGEEVIIPAPYWTTFPAQVLVAGGKPVFVSSPIGLAPSASEIASVIGPATRAIIINTPGNPTGVVYDRAMLQELAELAVVNDLWVIFDECYGSFTYESHEHLHILRVAPQLRDRTIVINAFSKQLAMTGWRIGFMAAPAAVIKATKALQSHTTSNPNVIAQHAVLAHLERSDGSYERALHARLSGARRLGLEVLQELKAIPAPAAQGGFYFYLDLRPLLEPNPSGIPRTADDVVATLLTAGIATVSGSAFGDPYGLRISYGAPVDQLEVGLRRLVDVLNAWE